MKVEIKSVKLGPGSEETIQFTGQLFVNGKKVADLSNDGRGGCNDIHPYEPYDANYVIIADVEKWAKSLPGVSSSFSDVILPMSLDLYISLAVGDVLKIKEDKKIEKKFEKYIIFGVKGGSSYKQMGWKGATIAQMKVGANAIRLRATISKIKAGLGKGETIWNTNLNGFI